ncbi:hypothetical protein IMZ48_06945 [Candidatus Bathyarchaeota archaeon]|nr:hypothetical protein [Candidatus Bathyarchaeota archaeon]
MKAGLWRSANATDGQKMGQSVRGRISNPIPIPNAGDDQFSLENPGSSPPKPHAPDEGDTISQRPPRSPRHNHQTTISSSSFQHTGLGPVSGDASDVAHSKSSGSNNSLSASAAPAATSGPSPTSGFTRDSPPRRTNPSSQIRYSVVTESSQRTGDTNNRDFPQRKKSTIRGALSKLFGRRKKSKSQGSNVPEHSSGTTSVQIRSVSLMSPPVCPFRTIARRVWAVRGIPDLASLTISI